MKKILVADDEIEEIDRLIAIISSLEVECSVAHCHSGESAVTMATANAPHLAIIDITFGAGRISGLTAAEKIWHANPHIDIVICSSDREGPEFARLRTRTPATARLVFCRKFDRDDTLRTTFNQLLTTASGLTPDQV